MIWHFSRLDAFCTTLSLQSSITNVFGAALVIVVKKMLKENRCAQLKISNFEENSYQFWSRKNDLNST